MNRHRGSAAGRATPLPPDERRRAIVEATVVLIRQEGVLPSTRRIADHAGIAEGTLFRAFGSKEALVRAIVAASACPYPFRRDVALLDRTLPLRDRTLAVARLLVDRFTEIFETLGPLGIMGPPRHGEHPGCPYPGEELRPEHLERQLDGVFAADVDQLRVDLPVLIDALRYLCFAGSHRGLSTGRLLDPETIVDLLLNGALRRDAPGARESDPPHRPDRPAHPPGATSC